MTELTTQQCCSLSDDYVARLNLEEITTYSQQLDPAWQYNPEGQTISHEFSFKNYYQTIAFVNVIAQIAHLQDHHPDMLISYNRCTVTYSTHSVNGLSIKDFICAAKIDTAQDL